MLGFRLDLMSSNINFDYYEINSITFVAHRKIDEYLAPCLITWRFVSANSSLLTAICIVD